jgi:hypothetical protein
MYANKKKSKTKIKQKSAQWTRGGSKVGTPLPNELGNTHPPIN